MYIYVVDIYSEFQYVTVIFSLQRSITNTINTISVAGNSTRILPDCVKTMQLFSRSQSWHISWGVFLYSAVNLLALVVELITVRLTSSPLSDSHPSQ